MLSLTAIVLASLTVLLSASSSALGIYVAHII